MTEREQQLTDLLRKERKEIDKLKATAQQPALKLRISGAGRMVMDTGLRKGFPLSLSQEEAELIFGANLERCGRWFQANRDRMKV